LNTTKAKQKQEDGLPANK